MTRIALSFLLAFLLAGTQTLFAQSSSLYHITHTYTLDGEGGWDYVVPDPPIIACSSAGKTE